MSGIERNLWARMGIAFLCGSLAFTGLAAAGPASAATEPQQGVSALSPTADAGENAAPSPLTVITGALKIYEFSDKCLKNLEAKRGCFDSGELARFESLRSDLAGIKAQMEVNQQATIDALNKVIAKITDQNVRASFMALQDQITYINIASTKYREYNDCLLHLSKPASLCALTDMNGNADSLAAQYSDPRTVEDLYKDLDKGPTGGPVARFLYSTLETFNKNPKDVAGGLRGTGLTLQHTIAGPKMRVENGLLFAYYDSQNAGLIAEQGGTPGSVPTLLTTDYLNRMNAFTSYYTNLEASYFSSVIAALQLQAREVAPTQTSSMLRDQANKGVVEERNLAIDKQAEDFSFPLSSPGTAANAWFIPGDGNLYRTRSWDVPATAAPNFDNRQAMPNFSRLALLSTALLRNNVNMSRLHSVYPQAFPGGDRDAYWSTFGDNTKRFQTRSWVPGFNASNESYYSGSESPDYGVWGDNVAVTSGTDCFMPVRMWDRKPSADDVWKQDYSNNAWSFSNSWNDTLFMTAKRGDGKKYFRVVPRSENVYNTVVRTGAVPAYSLAIGAEDASGGRYKAVKQGVGTLYRCGGNYDPRFAKPIVARYLQITSPNAGGLFDRLMGKSLKFKNCEDLRAVEWRGIGLPGSVDKTKGKAKKRAGYAANNRLFRADADWYDRNEKLDTDNDGIACEITQGRKFPKGASKKAIDEPEFTLTPESVVFGDQVLGGTTAPQTVTLTNDDSDDMELAVGGITLTQADAGQFAITANTCDGARLAEDESCTVQVTFTPTAAGAKTAGLEFNDQALGGPNVVGLSGTGVETAATGTG